LFIHTIIVDDIEDVAKNCRYGAPVGKAGAQMLWGIDLTWWLSDNPKLMLQVLENRKLLRFHLTFGRNLIRLLKPQFQELD
jgi:hypothetical protein